ncbi:kappa-type opioid receptor-like [Asterias rubens]|uniref:kappa-type opioid receptor-like n=1 Tax=Asterias rubens TaxID=7604 RepID=UPI00145558E9|nr:kappa-type opioid receptor-like [Asterias rubens]
MLWLTTHKEHPEKKPVKMNTMASILLDESTSEHEQIYIYEEDVINWEYSQVDTILITILVPILLCLGVINNSAFLFVIFRVPKMRSATNICLAHLAVADLLYLSVTSLVFNILSYTASPSVAFIAIAKSDAACFIFELLKRMGYFVSIALVTTVSLERYLAVCHPIQHLKVRGRRRTNTMVAICWVVGLMFACSTTLGISAVNYKLFVQWPEGYQDYPREVSGCQGLHSMIWRITLPLGVVPWFIAMFANVFMYVKIIYALNKRKSATL